MKQDYLKIMKAAADAYSYEYVESLYEENRKNGIKEPGISRLTAILGILISQGFKKEYYDLWIRLMDMCCSQLHTIRDGNDFAVREIMSCIVETKRVVPKEKTDEWLMLMGKIRYLDNYSVYAETLKDKVHNIGVYGMVCEQLREAEGLCDTTGYFDIQIPCQLKGFDELGMYKDPGCPMLYDLATRVQFSLFLFYGYKGEYRTQIDDNLKKGGLMSLMMQSACGEVPYGGRSNQMVFNEAYQCACFEYEAVRYKKQGNYELAGQFKAAAKKSYEAILSRCNRIPLKHVKNGYSWDSLFGCEWYAYYDKYMITLGSFAYMAYLFCDDSIEDIPCPAQKGGYVVKTSDDFHKVFANACGYSIQIDIKADTGYDATGIGRIHKVGISPETALSCPFPKSPKYIIADIKMAKMPDRDKIAPFMTDNPGFLSICPGLINEEGKLIQLCDFSKELESKVNVTKEKADCVEFDITYTSASFTGFTYMKEHYLLDEKGLNVCFTTDACETYERVYIVPVIKTNKESDSVISIEKDTLIAQYKQHTYTVTSKGCTLDIQEDYANRNGIYKKVVFKIRDEKININFEIK